ncbi:hypothetical protein ABZ479_25300, partial [Streptomyces sp. NPDC005722]
ASFETVSPAPPGFPFVVSSLADPISFSATLWSGFRFRRFRLGDIHYVSGFLRVLRIHPHSPSDSTPMEFEGTDVRPNLGVVS